MKPLTIGIAVLAVLVILSVIGVYYIAVPLDVQRLEADITLENRAAFKLTDDNFLHFGSIDTDQESTRSVVIENIRSAPITATVYIDGPPWLSVSENPIRLRPSQVHNVTFTADPPEDAEYGNYSWNISIVYRRW